MSHRSASPGGAVLAMMFWACRSPDPVTTALAPWPEELGALIVACDKEPFPELQTTCRVQAAAKAASLGDNAGADALCAAIEPGTWKEECHFRAGEELGRAGHTLPALRHCKEAGWFARNCLTHTAWRLPADPSLRPSTDPQQIAVAAEELGSGVEAALMGAGDGLEGEGRDLVLARFGYNLYVGSGETHPSPAHLPDPLGAALRTGFAIEVVRLEPGILPEEVLAVWKGERHPKTPGQNPPPVGFGRYVAPVLSPGERGLPHLPTYGGGVRLVGETAEEDVIIATLEALFWDPQQDGAVFIPGLDDPRARVRMTAMRLLRNSEGQTEGIDLPALFTRIRDHSPDLDLRWQAMEAIKHPIKPGSSAGTPSPGGPGGVGEPGRGESIDGQAEGHSGPI